MTWRDNMPVSMEVAVICGVAATVAAGLLARAPLWLVCIPVGWVAVMLVGMSVLSVLVKRSRGAVVLSLLVPLAAIGPAVVIIWACR